MSLPPEEIFTHDTLGLEPDMGKTDTFLCWFNDAEPEDGVEFSAFDHAHAAQQFADYAQSEMDMWEYSQDEWADEYSVVVKHLYTGTVKRFNITREYEPVFSATEVRDE
jgi:hypothetical protein